MSKKKKILVLSCMIALLAVTAIFNFVMTTDVNTQSSAVITNANYFSQYRSERQTTRNEELLQLDSIISAAETGSTERADALSMKIDLTTITEQELLLESLIKAYGFEDAVVVIGLQSNNVNVITKTAELTTDDAIKIYSIINEELSVSPENVKIIPIS